MARKRIKSRVQISLLIVSAISCLQASIAQTKHIDPVATNLPAWVTQYKRLHAAPELSGHEEKTAAYIASRLKSLGYTVTEHVGKFTDKPWNGYGVVATIKNGDGPVVLVRTDMDALPMEERTGLAYSSTVKTVNDAGDRVGVMHACGHDIHMAIFLGVAQMLVETKNQWQGTIVMVGQPAEEAGPGGSGAEALLNDGLYTRFPKPGFVLGLHQTPTMATGQVGVIQGYSNAVSGGGEIIVRGIASHPSRPQDGKDPVVLAAQIILALQTIVSRETNPLEPATLTIGAIHGGVAENAIPEEVKLKISFRALNQEVFNRMIISINRIVKGTALAAGVPDEKLPVVNIKQGYPANYNDPALTGRLTEVFKKLLGPARVETAKPLLTGEDFSYYSLDKKIPAFFFNVGSADTAQFRQSILTGVPLPANHSPLMVPVPDQTIKTGVISMTAAVMELLKRNH